ncbi:endonuclease V-like isoform X2 [Microtus oregoni]|uniref:endonuclease V-like isoform X2 n=1 Tax=Microtus oregoni TaxID=111838 RepID=UPI001BB11468|nr:endonuclease V-like isoform X2 [Microtus oregoni]
MALEAAARPPEETLLLWEREQARLKTRVVARDTEAWQRDPTFSGLQRVGGLDVSFVNGESSRACASLVVLSYPELECCSLVSVDKRALFVRSRCHPITDLCKTSWWA